MVATVGVLLSLVVLPSPALAFPTPSADTTAIPVTGEVTATVPGTVTVTLDKATIDAIGSSVASHSAPVTVTVPGTLTVTPAGLGAGDLQAATYLVVGLCGLGFALVLRKSL